MEFASASAASTSSCSRNLAFSPLRPRHRHGHRITATTTMGIKGLTKLLNEHAPGCMKELKFDSFSGHRIAIDASTSMYQFLIVVGRTGTTMLTNEAGDVTSHLQGMFTRTIRLLEAGIQPLYVFDGEPPKLKMGELCRRSSRREDAAADLVRALENGDRSDIEKFSKRTVKVTKRHSEDCFRLLQLMGVPALQAPGEAEAECTALCKSGKVYGVASEDMDSLTFGAPKFLKNLMQPISHKTPVVEFDIVKILECLEMTMDEFIDLCILCGCDYCDTIKGIGPQTALKLVRKHGTIECIIENLNKERYQVPDSWPFQEVRALFKDPVVNSPEKQAYLKWIPPDEEGLRTFLVDENNFNHDRVMKAIQRIRMANTKS